MPLRHGGALSLLLLSAAIAACGDANIEPTAPRLTPTALLSTTSGSGACPAGVGEVYVSVYPNTIAAGETATFYASVTATWGESLASHNVQWSVENENVAQISGTDGNGRTVATGRAGGSTKVIGTCNGGVFGSATLNVTGGAAPQEPAGDVEVTVVLSDPSLEPGQSAVASATTTDASGNQVAVQDADWESSNGAVATVTDEGVVTAIGSGTAVISATIQVGDAEASAGAEVAVSGSTTTPPPTVETPPTSGLDAVDAELPRAGVPDARYVAPWGRTIRVPAGGNVQQALNDAQPGDHVLLAAGASYFGNFVLPVKTVSNPCTAWVTVSTETGLPPEGTRVTPGSASSFAKLVTPNVDAALKTAPGASCWRVVGVEVTFSSGFSSLNYGLLLMGHGDETSLSRVSHGIVLDRVYVHGHPHTNFTRCIALNSARSAIINSWVSDCHARGFDSQAIAGWNGPGPYLIENNYLEGAGENVMFGGSDPRIYDLVPSDITIRRNHFNKPLAWKGSWTVKNLFELKSARRLLIEGNVFENNWADAQSGMAIVIKSSNDGGTGPWQGTTDVTFRYNIVRNSPQGLNVAARPEENPVVTVARVNIENNLFENIGDFYGTISGRMLILLNELRDVTIANNTMIHNTWESGVMAIFDYSNGTARNIVFRDNVATRGGPYGAVIYSGIRIGTESMNAFAGSSWAFDRNVVIGLEELFVSWHPSGSWYPSTMDAVGFMNAAGGDYRLGSSSPYKGKGSNGRDPGADIDRLRQETSGVIVN